MGPRRARIVERAVPSAEQQCPGSSRAAQPAESAAPSCRAWGSLQVSCDLNVAV